MLACTPLINDSPVSSATLGSATSHHHSAALQPHSRGNDASLTNHTRLGNGVSLSSIHERLSSSIEHTGISTEMLVWRGSCKRVVALICEGGWGQ